MSFPLGSHADGSDFRLPTFASGLDSVDALSPLFQLLDRQRTGRGPTLRVPGLKKRDGLLQRLAPGALTVILADDDLAEPDALLADVALDLLVVGRASRPEYIPRRFDRDEDLVRNADARRVQDLDDLHHHHRAPVRSLAHRPEVRRL